MRRLNPFEDEEIFLRHLTIDRQTGDIVLVPFDYRSRRDLNEVMYYTIEALDAFFGFFKLELRDVEHTLKRRPEPLSDLLEIRGNLATIDTLTPLSDVLTEEVEAELRRMTFADCVAQARAEVEAIFHNGVYVNTIITLSPYDSSQPFSPRHTVNKVGNCYEPVRLPNGNYQFALSEPFHNESHYPQTEADLGAWHIDAILMEYVDKRQ